MRGPKPTPRNLRIVRGADKPSRMNDDEPIVPVTVPDAPEDLDEDEAKEFTKMATKLAKMRVMSESDVEALEIYARAAVEARKAHRMVLQGGLMVTVGKNKDYFQQNPYLTVRNAAEKKALNILTEFGMTPSSRTRVKAQ